MKRFLQTMACVLLVGGVLPGPGVAWAEATEAELHLGHVTTSWVDTPGKAGLLPVSREDGEIALEHAGYALAKGNSIAVVKEHADHVLHALDPEAVAFGPGTGYGLIRAMTGVRDHLGFAAQSEDASDDLRKATPKLIRRAEWVIKRAKVMRALCEDVERSADLEDALILTEEIQNLARQVLDKNGISGIEAGVEGLARREAAASQGDKAKKKAAVRKKSVRKGAKTVNRKSKGNASGKTSTRKKASGVYNAYGGSGGDR